MSYGITAAPVKVYLGIDLGTTNTCAYFSRGDTNECLDMENGERLLPSYVEYKKNQIIIGGAAKKRAIANNVYLVHNAKRLIGRKSDDPCVKKFVNCCGCKVDTSGESPSFIVDSNGKKATPVEVSTELISSLITRCNDRSGSPVTDICITIPAHFDENQRSATLKAVQNCGFNENHIRILNEPTAAALCYENDNTINNENILVYDFGGGTFDVSILNVVNGKISVKMYRGDNSLGGADFDSIIVEWIKKRYREVYNRDLIDPSLDEIKKQRCQRRLLVTAEEAKISLSTITAAEICASSIVGTVVEDDQYDFVLHRSTLDELLNDSIERSIAIVHEAIKEAKLTVNTIDQVVLVGGSSRLILVKEKLQSIFGNKKLKETVNPDECVAKGACYSLMNNYIPEEIIAFSLGQEVIGNQIQCIIPCHSKLPKKLSVTNYTSQNYQEKVLSAVYQGDQRINGDCVDIKGLVKLSPFSYIGFEKKLAGEVEFRTTFEIKESGIVYVTVEEVKTKKMLLHDHKICWQH